MKLSTVFLSTTAILLATSALAADLPTMKAPPAPAPMLATAPYSWTGFHIGLGGGLAAMQVKSSSDSYLNYNNNGESSSHSSGGERSDLGKFAPSARSKSAAITRWTALSSARSATSTSAT
jgi:hypothetical protein